MGSRTHTSLIREQTACHTITNRFLYGDTDQPAGRSGRVECADKDQLERMAKISDVPKDDDKRGDDIEDRHDRDHLLGNRSNPLNPAEEDKRRRHCNHCADHQFVPSKSGFKRGADRVGLHHVAHKSKRKDDEHRERRGKHLTKSPLEGFLNIVNRAAGDMAVYVGLVFLGQGCLSIDRRHSKKCRKPHPEDRARSARNDCTRRTRDIPGADLCRNRCRQRLERTHPLLVSLCAKQLNISKYCLKRSGEPANLHKIQPDGEIDSGAAEQKRKNDVP